MIKKDQVWALQENAELQPVSQGFSRKILAYGEEHVRGELF